MKVFLDANICLDLLDSTRNTSKNSIDWYMQNKDSTDKEFCFSGDFITTIYYHLTQKRKLDAKLVIEAIDALCAEITPFYLNHNDFQLAKKSFFDGVFDDFEDLIVLHSGLRAQCATFITNDKKLLNLGKLDDLCIVSHI
ncbi:MAG: type II toxin-antitoxin system VapC family toxin [Sulfurimonas sp.]|uniref:type II toxin-antitoxin system VapC family toxin n=1 Tax=Sulfurimonas sp. TaxID=2022749 RepID=UPI003D096203